MLPEEVGQLHEKIGRDFGDEFSRSVEPGSAGGFVVVPNNTGDVFPGQVGTAIVTSDRPVIVLVNTFALPFGSRDSSTYNGIGTR